MLTNFTNKPVLFQKHVGAAVPASFPAYDSRLRDSSISAEEEAHKAADVATADQASLINDRDKKNERQ